MLRCNVCSTMDNMERVMQPKWDTVKKHEGRRKALVNMPKYKVKKGKWYMAKNSKHMKNLTQFNAQSLDIVL